MHRGLAARRMQTEKIQPKRKHEKRGGGGDGFIFYKKIMEKKGGMIKNVCGGKERLISPPSTVRCFQGQNDRDEGGSERGLGPLSMV